MIFDFMKLYKQIILILIIFLKTGNLLSQDNIFNVNNIQLEKNEKTSTKELSDQAIKDGFKQLTNKILLKDDIKKLSDLNFASIKELVTYYQISNKSDIKERKDFVNFSVTFDKDKIHNLFYKRGISYSDILDKELYILPILIKNDEIYVFNNNFFYDNWNKIYEEDLIEFILPLENIEIIQNINLKKNNLISLDVRDLLKEYQNKNLSLILIDESNGKIENVYIKSVIQGKNMAKSFNFKNEKLNSDKLYEKIIEDSKKELVNLVKSKNLIDIRTPSFLVVKFNLNKKNNLVELNTRIKNIDLIENIYVQEFNKDYMRLKIKYLGKLEKIINQLKNENINLILINDQWTLKTF